MRAALAVFLLAAMWAAHTCLAAQLGARQSIPLTLAVAALLLLGAIRYERAQPVSLKIGVDELSGWDAAGTLLLHGRIAGCSLWSGRLLILLLQPRAGRMRTLLLPADSLPAPVFRHLSVLGRRAAGA